MTKTLAVLGAGIGGLSVVQELHDQGFLDDDALDVVLVDEDFSHCIGFTLPWVMRGWREADRVRIAPSRQSLHGVRKVIGSVESIDTQRRKVFGSGFEVDYDALVVALGAKNDLGKVPGLAEAHQSGAAHHFYSVEDAQRAHEALEGFTGGKALVLIPTTPFRCPVAPYEGAMLVNDFLAERGLREKTQIDVFTAEPRPMPSAGDGPGRKVIAMLAEAEIGFHPDARCQSVDGAARTVAFADGSVADFDLLLFVPPHAPALSLDEGTGWIPVDHRTLATGRAGVWAIGDISSVTTPSGLPLPKAAVMAKGQARIVAHEALRYLGLATQTSEFAGEGYCFIDTGNGRAARGMGDFYALPAPKVELAEPSAELRELKEREEQEWAALWA